MASLLSFKIRYEVIRNAIYINISTIHLCVSMIFMQRVFQVIQVL